MNIITMGAALAKHFVLVRMGAMDLNSITNIDHSE